MASAFPFLPSREARGFRAFFGRCFGFFFSLIFLGAGLLILCKELEPWGMWFSARHWVPASAWIESSRLASDRDSDGDRTYWIEVKYRYEAGGKEYLGDRYGFDRDKSNIGVEFKRREVGRLAAGAKVTCWVNPRKPEEAVLQRDRGTYGLIGLFFPLPFLAVGVTGVVAMLFGPALLRWHDRRRRALLRRLRDAGRIVWTEEPEEGLPVRVIVAWEERLKAVGGLTFINLFWNGIVTVFLLVAATEATQGNRWAALGLGLFLVPFVMVGAAMLWQGVRAWRNLFRPNWLAVLDPVPGFDGPGETTVSFVALPDAVRGFSPVRKFRLAALGGRFDENGNPVREGDFGCWLPWKRKEASRKGPCELAVYELPVTEEGLCVTVPYEEVPLSPAPECRGKEERFWGRWWELQVENADGSTERFDAFG